MTTQSLLARLQKTTTLKNSSVLGTSNFFTSKDVIQTSVPMINVALSGRVDGGMSSGLTTIAGPSRHFKSAFGLLLIQSFLNKYEDGICIFYDSEFGAPPAYFESFGIDTSRIIHAPIMNIEELKFDVVKQLEEIGRDDHVMIFVDSIGNLASKKEIEDAINEKSVADMTRAKQLKSLFRMVTPYLTMHDIPMVVINHTYDTQEMFSKKVVSGGTGVMYSSDNVWIVGRQQEKDGKELSGYNFMINVEKSRHVKEKSIIPINVTFDDGISKWSGLLDVAVELGLVVKPKQGWYARTDENGEVEDKSWRAKQTNSSEFWKPYFDSGRLAKALTSKYALGEMKMTGEEMPEVPEDDENEVG